MTTVPAATEAVAHAGSPAAMAPARRRRHRRASETTQSCPPRRQPAWLRPVRSPGFSRSPLRLKAALLAPEPSRPRPEGLRAFTLLEVMVVVVIMAIVLGLAAPRVGRVPSRVQSEYCVSAVRTVLDVASLRARTTGQACRLVLVPSVEAGGGSAGGSPWWAKALSRWGIVNRPSVVSDEDLETCTFVVERADPDPLAQMLSGRAAMTRGTTASETGSGSNAGVYGLAQDQFSLPDAVAWDPDSIRAATGDGARGPAFLFHCSGEAAGPVLEFGVGKRHYRLEVDPLTGRVDIAAVTRR